MNKNQTAIVNVINKRKERGATDLDIRNYLDGLLETWKNNNIMIQFIENLKGGN